MIRTCKRSSSTSCGDGRSTASTAPVSVTKRGAFQVTNTWRKKPEDLRTMRKTFTTFATKCADATIAGPSPVEQYWQAHDQLESAKPAKVTKDKCLALYQVAKRTAAAASSTAPKDVEDLGDAEHLPREVRTEKCGGRRARTRR
jgi:hypothetical protein